MSRLILPRALAATCLALAGCSRPVPDEGRQAPSPPVAAAEEAAAPRLTASVPSGPDLAELTGEWRVAGIDGAEVAGDMGIAVSVTTQTLSYEPKCLGFAWLLQVSAPGRIRLQRDPRYGAQRQPDGAVLSCAAAVPPAFYRLGQALDRVEQARLLDSGGVELTGGGRSVLLFRQ